MKNRMMESSWILHSILTVWLFSAIYAMEDTELEVDASAASGQMPNPVGASRVFPKTSFTCKNRPAGYYADVETGCQVYHMCDGVGRQFSYACPNTTLFQQRMLICDHWYMVNCSRAEDDYAANLLIGQRDKPFVPENEHQQRTPRPDLLDRPYAPDYSGESFRNNFKDLPSIQNHISDSFSSKQLSKPSPTRWSLKNALKAKENKLSTFNTRRSDNADENDLGTSFSLRYNSTGDISSEQTIETHSHKTTDNNTIEQNEQTAQANVKVPSKYYEPPFLHPIYNENYTEESTSAFSTATITPTTITTTTQATTSAFSTESHLPLVTDSTSFTDRPHDLANIISSTTFETTTYKKSSHKHDSSNFVHQTSPITEKQQTTTVKSRKATKTEDRTEGAFVGRFSPFEPRKKDKIPFGLPAESIKPDVLSPARDLLPPFQEYIVHDVATTQGPPIYYEWKTPSDSLEPPKLSVETGNGDDSPGHGSLAPTNAPSFANNPFLSSLLRTKNSSPTEGSFSTQTDDSKITISGGSRQPFRRLAPEYPTDQQIEDLQRELLIPNFLFPLENEGRTGYELADPLDSFQLKIPRKRSLRRLIRRS